MKKFSKWISVVTLLAFCFQVGVRECAQVYAMDSILIGSLEEELYQDESEESEDVEPADKEAEASDAPPDLYDAILWFVIAVGAATGWAWESVVTGLILILFALGLDTGDDDDDDDDPEPPPPNGEHTIFVTGQPEIVQAYDSQYGEYDLNLFKVVGSNGSATAKKFEFTVIGGHIGNATNYHLTRSAAVDIGAPYPDTGTDVGTVTTSGSNLTGTVNVSVPAGQEVYFQLRADKNAASTLRVRLNSAVVIGDPDLVGLVEWSWNPNAFRAIPDAIERAIGLK